jgi:hypothetical protein
MQYTKIASFILSKERDILTYIYHERYNELFFQQFIIRGFTQE